jgi:hypothetical protein
LQQTLRNWEEFKLGDESVVTSLAAIYQMAIACPNKDALAPVESDVVFLLTKADVRLHGDTRPLCTSILSKIGVRQPLSWVRLTLAVEDRELPLSMRIHAIRFLLPEGGAALLPSLRRLLAACPEGEDGQSDRSAIDRLLAAWDPDSPQRKKTLAELGSRGWSARKAMRDLMRVGYIDAAFLPHLIPLLDDDTELDVGMNRPRDMAAYCIARILGPANPVRDVVEGQQPEASDLYWSTTEEERSKIRAAAQTWIEKVRSEGKERGAR